ncbi:MAG: mannonate dehydratase, partial [Bosea sp. (in: a-proteobacteria)]
MEQSWRWFGPDDLVTLPHIRQAGATGIVTSLHHIPYGVVWSIDEIEKRKAMIAADASLGLRWNVVESLPLHEDIKLGQGPLAQHFDAYRQSMRNLAACGIKTICYNFMPILDWTRTDLAHPLPGGGRALRFDAVKFCA